MRLFAMTLTVLASVANSPILNADDNPKRSPELQVLDRFVGTWDFVVLAYRVKNQAFVVFAYTTSVRIGVAFSVCFASENLFYH